MGQKFVSWPVLCLTALTMFHLTIHLVWSMRNLAPPWWDQAGYYWGNLRLWRAFESDGIGQLLHDFLALSDRSPLFNCVAVPFFALFGETERAGMVIVWSTFVLLLVMVYQIGALYGSAAVGLLAALVTSCMPLLFGLSRQFLAEVPLAAVAAGLAYLGIRSAGFQRRKATMLFGLLLGLGLLLKVTFLVYGAGIGVGVMVQRLKDPHLRRVWSITAGRDIVWAVVPAVAIASFWYIPNFTVAVGFIVEYGYGRIIQLYGPLQWGPYYSGLINHGMSAYVFLAGVVACGAALYVRAYRPQRASQSNLFPPVVLAWFLLPLGVFSLGNNPDIRFLAPALPAVGVLVSVWIAAVFTRRQLPWAICLSSVFPLSSVLLCSLSTSLTPWQIGPLVLWGRDDHYVYAPVRQDWRNEEVLNVVQALHQNNRTHVNVAFLADEKFFESNWFNFLAARKQAQLSFLSIPWTSPDFSLHRTLAVIAQSDFIVVKSHDSERGSLHVNHITRYSDEVRALLRDERLPFLQASERIVLPDGSRVFIYHRKDAVSGSTGQH